MAEKMTLNDVVVTQVTSTDRIELAIEEQTKSLKKSMASAASSNPLAGIIGPHPLQGDLISIRSDVELMHSMMLWLLCGIIAICVMIFIFSTMTIATLRHMTTYDPNLGEQPEGVKASDFVQSISNEEEASPETSDQSSPQSEDGEPHPENNSPSEQAPQK